MSEQSTEMINPWLGMRPFILIELKELDEDGNPKLDIRFGGGFTAEDVPLFIGDLAESLAAGDDNG